MFAIYAFFWRSGCSSSGRPSIQLLVFAIVLSSVGRMADDIHKRDPVKRRHAVAQNVVSERLPVALAPFLPPSNRRAPIGGAHRHARLDCARDVFPHCRRQLNKLAALSFQRQTMFVFPPRRIWPERRNENSALALDGLRIPGPRRSVILRRHPPLNVPSIVRRIFRHVAQLDHLTNCFAGGIAILPLAADPRKPRPTPHRARSPAAAPPIRELRAAPESPESASGSQVLCKHRFKKQAGVAGDSRGIRARA